MMLDLIVFRRAVRPVCLALLAAALAVGCNTSAGGGLPGNGGGSGGGSSGGSAGSSVSASLLEQLSLERINRARLKPADEADALGISLNEGVPSDRQISTDPKQPLAMNDTLRQVARSHSRDMLDRNYFAHEAPEGVDPFDRLAGAGYTYTAAGENLAWGGTTGTLVEIDEVETQHRGLFVDEDIVDRGHRVTMLIAVFREIGVGILRGNFTNNGTVFDSLMQSQEYGAPSTNVTFILGVVYDDGNNNGQYDAGEGTANSTVSLGSTATMTNDGGGYAFEVGEAGTYTLRFASGQTQAITLSSGAPNIKVDLVNGSRVVINLGLGPLD